MSLKNNSVEELIRIYSYLSGEAPRFVGKKPIFKPTGTAISVTRQLVIPKDKFSFENFIRNLYILLYEGSGYGKRLPSIVDKEKIINKIKELRNHYEHDREHGKESEIIRKHEKVGDIFEFLIGKRIPSRQQDWISAGTILIEKCIDLLHGLLEALETNVTVKENEQRGITEFFEHDMTIFPNKKEKFRIIKKYGEFTDLSTSVLFLPTFYWSTPAEFGNTNSAVYLTSVSPSGDFDGFTKFISEIGMKWNDESNYEFSHHSKLMPWSISGRDYVIYGSGSENLIEALKDCYTDVRACISMILQGIYGEDNTCTFFIVIGSDLKYGRFRYNFIDFYLSNIPIEWNWIKSINNSLDKLSTGNIKASSYSLRSYFYQVWEGVDMLSICNDVIGGIGRSGFNDKREWDMLEGIILKKEKFDGEFVLSSSNDWKSDSELNCPKDYLDEFVVSVTNRPPDVEEVRTGKLIGIYQPKIYVLGFPAKGWSIYAINVWGTSKLL